jgi:hypothetical protein
MAASTRALTRRALQLPSPRVGADGVDVATRAQASTASARDGSA